MISGVFYSLSENSPPQAVEPAPAKDTIYASFYFLDGSEDWKPLNLDLSIETIEAFQEMENTGLKNMILELDRDPFAAPTDDHPEKAWELYRSSFRVAEENGWFDYDKATSDGFYHDPTDPYHYPHSEYLFDDERVVPERPEFLMFYEDPERPGEQVLAGVMYQQPTLDAHGAQVGGAVTRWHKHIYGTPVCLDERLMPHSVRPGGQCNGVPSSVSPEMLHVWFVDHPHTQFASEMALPIELIKTSELMSRDEFMRKHGGR